jgi:hypothetical protein
MPSLPIWLRCRSRDRAHSGSNAREKLPTKRLDRANEYNARGLELIRYQESHTHVGTEDGRTCTLGRFHGVFEKGLPAFDLLGENQMS